jgi:outer membrane protein OmpA-like peptidoglycan-associated protein
MRYWPWMMVAGLLLSTPAHAFDFLDFSIKDTLRCAHPTTKLNDQQNLAEYLTPPQMEGPLETARVRVNYVGLMRNNTMVLDYQLAHASETLKLIHAKVVEESSRTGHRQCDYFRQWSELKADGAVTTQETPDKDAKPQDLAQQAVSLASGETIKVATLEPFDYHATALKPEMEPALSQLTTLLGQLDASAFRLRVIGHTDSVGPRAANQALSEQRAAAVMERLKTNTALSAWEMTAEGQGETRLVNKDGTETEMAANRRVELLLQHR